MVNRPQMLAVVVVRVGGGAVPSLARDGLLVNVISMSPENEVDLVTEDDSFVPSLRDAEVGQALNVEFSGAMAKTAAR